MSNLACPPTECLVGYTQEEWFCDRWQGWGCSYAVGGFFFFLFFSLGGLDIYFLLGGGGGVFAPRGSF